MPDKNHHYSDEMISAYLDDELTLEERQKVEQWLSVDQEARELMMQLSQLRDQLRGGLQQPVPPLNPSFAARVLSRINEAQPQVESGQSGSAAHDTATNPEVARIRTRFESGWQRGLIWATGIVAASIALLLSQQFYPRSEQHLAQYDSPASDKAAGDRAAENAPAEDTVGGNAVGRGGSPGNSSSDNALPGRAAAVAELPDNDAAAADAPASFAAKGGETGGAAELAKQMTAADHLEINDAAVRRDALPSRSRQFAAPAQDVDAANQALSQSLPDEANVLPPPSAPLPTGATTDTTAGTTAATQDGFERSELRDSRDLASVSLQRQVVQAQITRDQLPSVANQLTADHHDFYQLPDNQRNDLAANVVSESVGSTQRRLVVPEATSPTPDVVQVFVDSDADAVISSLQKLPNVNWTVLPSEEWLRQAIPEVTQVQQSLQTKVGRRPPVLLMLQLQDHPPTAADVELDPAR